MANIISEFKRKSPGHVLPTKPILFDSPYQNPAEITYDPAEGEIIFHVPGIYSIKWWVATETAQLYTIQFALAFSQDGKTNYIPGCSPIKTGQVSGFGFIDVKADGAKLSLINSAEAKAIFSLVTETKAYLQLMRVNTEYSHEPIGVYHANLSTAGSFYEVQIGNVIYRLQYVSSTVLAMYVKSTGETVTVDIKRSSQADSYYDGRSLDNHPLTALAQNMDPSITCTSVEMHRTWIRQKDPDSELWSLHEVELFPSATEQRVSICVYRIYENIDLSGL